VLAAGAVPMQHGPDGPRVLLIHRPRHDDWTLPKGHLDPGEHPLLAATREVTEETGLTVRLGPALPTLAYPIADGRSKVVRFWLGEVIGDPAASEPLDRHEVDSTAWLPAAQAYDRLTYEDDRKVVDAAVRVSRHGPLTPLLVVRHAHARSRSKWERDDQERPLAGRGRREATDLVRVLDVFRPDRLVSSDAVRCRQTVAPLATHGGLEVELDHRLSEDTSGRRVRSAIGEVVRQAITGRSTVLCSHRPTLPAIFDALGVAPMALSPGAFVVVHLRRDGTAVAAEHHDI